MNIGPAGYLNLRINGPISAKRVESDEIEEPGLLLIVGPTGAGKSTFIEALAQDASLHLSSNQLDGFTQTVNTYNLMNVDYSESQISLVDVPGFADTRISMMSIVSMLKAWMRESGAVNFGRILYFTPIHGVRLPGSHREVLRTFQVLTGAKTAGNITIVTSMWDNLWGDGAKKRAESNFNQLQDTVWKEFVDKGAQIVKFHNTQASALYIPNTVFRDSAVDFFHLETQFRGQTPLQSAPFGKQLTEDLQSRIQNLEIELANTEMNLKGASERGDDILTSMLIPKLKETAALLAKFQKELYDNFAAIMHTTPSSSALSRAAELESCLQQPLPMQTPSSPSNQPGVHVSATADPIQQKQQLIVRVISLVKCWGDAVADCHDA
ncbi:hypothetical protein BJ165DRAFT_1533494 [Panaeolus papilionaceus]|nr:hypothetical protein BJ165DRAFT_1533494 [Panaeolus papilionaceus]